MLAKPALGPRFAPVSGSKGPRLVFLQLVAIPVHGYDIEYVADQVPGLVILRRHANLLTLRPDTRWKAPVSTRDAPTLAVRLTRAEKQAQGLLAAWPLCATEQRLGLTGRVARRRVN